MHCGMILYLSRAGSTMKQKKKKSFSTKSTKLNTFSLVTTKTNLNIEDAYLNRVVKYTETKQDD